MFSVSMWLNTSLEDSLKESWVQLKITKAELWSCDRTCPLSQPAIRNQHLSDATIGRAATIKTNSGWYWFGVHILWGFSSCSRFILNILWRTILQIYINLFSQKRRVLFMIPEHRLTAFCNENACHCLLNLVDFFCWTSSWLKSVWNQLPGVSFAINLWHQSMDYTHPATEDSLPPSNHPFHRGFLA